MGEIERMTANLSPVQLQALADQLLDEASHRGLFVQIAAAFEARRLRERAAALTPTPEAK